MNLKVWRLNAFYCLQWLLNLNIWNGDAMTIQYVQHGTYMVSTDFKNTSGSAVRVVGAESALDTSSFWQVYKSSVSYGLG